MGRINVLNKHVSELIAAGEVVERPASVVKELLENSIDAMASKVIVEIKKGGIKYIKISDNGSGIHSGDVKKAFLRHATSKLKDEQDLDSIKTLGFRGEALASICSVSKMELITKSSDENFGTRYVIVGSEEKKFEKCGCPTGTTFIVTDVFFNTPARMKFLKTDISEGNAICALVDNISLSNPKVSFKMTRDGKEILNTPGDGKISSCIYSVFGKNFFEELIPIEYEMKNIKISGYISKPSCSRPSRNMQRFFINSRYVKTKIASSALEEAFKGCVTSGRYPSCVIYINVPYNFVDINVHPSKTEVKFADDRAVFDAIYYGVKSSIMKNDKPVLEFPKNNEFKKSYVEPKISDLVKKERLNSSAFESNFGNLKFCSPAEKIIKNNDSKDLSVEKESTFKIFKEGRGSQKFADENVQSDFTFPREPFESPLTVEENININNSICAEEEKQNLFKNSPNLKILGEIFKCYIVIQNGCDSILLIDKHAAHERIIFEKLKSFKDDKCESQMLINPIVATLSKNEYSCVIENLQIFKNSGYDVEDFGTGNILIRSIPMYTDASRAKDFVIEISNYILKNKKDLNSSYLDWLYHNIACRAAIKSGSTSSNKEILELVNRLINNPEIKYCPHGRPIYFSISKKDIDKKFGRT